MIAFAASPNDPNIFEYQNIERFKSTGGNLTGTYNYKNWNLSLGFGYLGSYNQFSEDDKSLPDFKWAAEINSIIGYNFSKIGLNANLFYKFTGKIPFYQLVDVQRAASNSTVRNRRIPLGRFHTQ